MNNYSTQESEKAMSEMRDFDYAIPDFIAKIRPKNFEDILGRSVSASYVDKIMGRFLREFNSKFVPELNDVLKNNKERVNLWTDGIDQVEGLVNNNWKGIKILKENFNILREEVEKLKSAAVDTNEWQAPANLDMF